MILISAATLAAAASMTLPISDPQAQGLADACVTAAVRQLSEGASRVVLQDMRVRCTTEAWRIEYEVTLEDRSGRSHAWVGECTIAAPHVVVFASR